MRTVFPFLMLCVLAFTACTNRKEEVPDPGMCDTTQLQYSKDPVHTIINTKCAVTGCHLTGTSAPGDFSNYTQLKATVDNGTFSQRVFVVKDMPQVGSLSDCEFVQLKAWVNSGAPD